MQRWHITGRPRQFKQVLGQAHVKRFLDVILNDFFEKGADLPVGFLFGGSSGIGKTTIARVIGCSLNCEHKQGNEPCGKCVSCEKIVNGRGLVMEIDASIFGLVANVRKLSRDLQAYTFAEYQVVILDEAHMMSTEASNVLLKLLEDPPDRVLFILCTTDITQIIGTVRSRLLEFRFRDISWLEIKEYLKKLSKQEGLKCDMALCRRLYFLSKKNFRDFIVVLEQLASLNNGVITEKEANELFGDVRVFEKILDAMNIGDYVQMVELYQEVSSFYVDFYDFLNGLLVVLGEAFLTVVRNGSPEAKIYSKLLHAIYKFQVVSFRLTGEAAAMQLFHILAEEGRGIKFKQTLVKNGEAFKTSGEVVDFFSQKG